MTDNDNMKDIWRSIFGEDYPYDDTPTETEPTSEGENTEEVTFGADIGGDYADNVAAIWTSGETEQPHSKKSVKAFEEACAIDCDNNNSNSYDNSYEPEPDNTASEENQIGKRERRKMMAEERRRRIERERREERDRELENYNSSAIRQNRTRRTGCVGALLYFIFIVCLSTLLASVGWLVVSDVLAFGFDDEVVEFTVDEDYSIDELAQKLKDEGLVKYAKLFKLYAAFSNADEKINPGTYSLNKNYDYHALVTYMHDYSLHSSAGTVTVRIVEGSTMEQIITQLAKSGVSSEEELWDAAANYDYSYFFLSDDTLGDSLRLEGYLFPDTYEFYIDENPVQALDKLLSNFASKISDAMLDAIEGSGYTLRDVITVASMIEKETDGSDRELIASVIYNRLENPDYETVGMLQIDAALYYGLDKSMDEKLTNADLEKDTPYNTYIYSGLTPTPIANPGLASISAAVFPADTDYYYYALNSDGLHHFSHTLAEQNQFLASESAG